jgi:hypothetical protein
MGSNMAVLVRILLWLAWAGAAGWSWHAGVLGAGSALALGALSLVVFAWPGSIVRRRGGGAELRYVDMGKH